MIQPTVSLSLQFFYRASAQQRWRAILT